MSDIAAVPLDNRRSRNWLVAILALVLIGILPIAAATTKNCIKVPGAFDEGFSDGFDKAQTACNQQSLALVMFQSISFLE